MLHVRNRIPSQPTPRADDRLTPRSRTSRRAAFTLMELILVLGVLVVLTAITLPGILRWQRALPLEQAVSILQLQLQETRAAAVRSGEAWSLILPHPHEPWRREPVIASQDRIQHYRFRLPAGIRCEIIEPAGTPSSRQEPQKQIVFQPDGTVHGCRLRITTNDGIVTILQIHRMTGLATVVRNGNRDLNQKLRPQAIASKCPERRSKVFVVRS